MSFTLWRGVVGMVRPTRRPGTLEELIRILPEGIGIVPLLLNFKAGSTSSSRTQCRNMSVSSPSWRSRPST